MYFEDFKCLRATSPQTIKLIVTCRALQIIVQVTEPVFSEWGTSGDEPLVNPKNV